MALSRIGGGLVRGYLNLVNAPSCVELGDGSALCYRCSNVGRTVGGMLVQKVV
ncbi:MAG: hypothetical protein KAH86_08815 [Methanosarcinales archaeon]|nr:hypothetical protein [Methanosarcinales archaeon]